MSTDTTISLYQVRSYCLNVGVRIKSMAFTTMPDLLDKLQDIHPSNICMFNLLFMLLLYFVFNYHN